MIPPLATKRSGPRRALSSNGSGAYSVRPSCCCGPYLAGQNKAAQASQRRHGHASQRGRDVQHCRLRSRSHKMQGQGHDKLTMTARRLGDDDCSGISRALIAMKTQNTIDALTTGPACGTSIKPEGADLLYSLCYVQKSGQTQPRRAGFWPPGPGDVWVFPWRADGDDFGPGLAGWVGDQLGHPEGVQVMAPNSRL